MLLFPHTDSGSSLPSVVWVLPLRPHTVTALHITTRTDTHLGVPLSYQQGWEEGESIFTWPSLKKWPWHKELINYQMYRTEPIAQVLRSYRSRGKYIFNYGNFYDNSLNCFPPYEDMVIPTNPLLKCFPIYFHYDLDLLTF